MMNLRHLALGFLAIGTIGAAGLHADVIDFSVIDQFAPTGRIARIGPAAFSYSSIDYDDGFELYDGGNYVGGAYNYYGENFEHIDFDQPITLDSVDLATFDQYIHNQPDTVILNLYDSGGSLIASPELLVSSLMQTFPINVSNVSTIEFEFTGGAPFRYGDNRNHAWWYVDNIVYNSAPSAPTLSVDINPCPSGGALELSWSNATPNGQIAILYARTTGNFTIPNNFTCAGTMLGLGATNLQVAFQGNTGANGTGILNTNIPALACGGFIQLIDVSTCATSNVEGL